MPLFQFEDNVNKLEKSLLFIHIPKTGGTSVEVFFEKLGCNTFLSPKEYRSFRKHLKIAPAHYDINFISEIFDLNSIYSFTIVRNPLDRIFSIYNWVKDKSTNTDDFKKMSFDNFIDYSFNIKSDEDPIFYNMIKPQSDFISNKLDKIFKLELGLKNIFKEIFLDIGLNINGDFEVPFLNKSNSDKNSLNDHVIEKINKYYQKDFKEFNYY